MQYGQYPSASGSGITKYPTFAALPGSAANGDIAVVVDTASLYIYDSGTWGIYPSAGASTFQEVPTGAIDGLNVTFTLSQAPSANQNLVLFRSQLVLVQGVDYTISGSTITTTTPPEPAQPLYAVCIGSVGGGGGGAWGSISGNINDQADLQVQFNTKQDALGFTPLSTLNNLSDLTNLPTARANLGLGSASTQASSFFAQVANNLSDLTNATTARTNLGLGTAAVQASSFFSQVANNLSDLTSASTARTNLGLGTAAVQNVGAFEPAGAAAAAVAAIPNSDATHTGLLTSADWNLFNSKQSALSFGDFTDSSSGADGISVTGGVGAVIGGGVSISQQKADATHAGYLSAFDWNTFNNKLSGGTSAYQEIPTGVIDGVNTVFTLSSTPNPVSTLQLYLDGKIITQTVDYTIVGTTITMAVAPLKFQFLQAVYINSTVSTYPSFIAYSPLIYSLGDLTIQQADSSNPGYLSSADWNTFNNKQNVLGTFSAGVDGLVPHPITTTGRMLRDTGVWAALTSSDVTSVVLTGFAETGGQVLATDTLMQALAKLAANSALQSDLLQANFTIPSNYSLIRNELDLAGFDVIIDSGGTLRMI